MCEKTIFKTFLPVPSQHYLRSEIETRKSCHQIARRGVWEDVDWKYLHKSRWDWSDPGQSGTIRTFQYLVNIARTSARSEHTTHVRFLVNNLSTPCDRVCIWMEVCMFSGDVWSDGTTTRLETLYLRNSSMYWIKSDHIRNISCVKMCNGRTEWLTDWLTDCRNCLSCYS